MHISILHNQDHALLEEDPGREAREDITRVAAALADALDTQGVTAEPLEASHDMAFVQVLQRRRPALVVNLCESLAADSRGEMAVPCVLDLLGVPYTGSSALALGLCLHKPKAKEILRGRGVPTPEFQVVERLGDLKRISLPFPDLIVKPSREDASMGVDFDSVVTDRASLHRAVAEVLMKFRQPALVERYVPGRELYVPILGNDTKDELPLSEIHFGAAFKNRPNVVSYRAKWMEDSPEFQDSPSGPCTLPPALEARVRQLALTAFAALDCRDYGRVDFRLSAEGEPFVIDVNPNCDLHPEAGFAKAAAAAGFDYRALALRLVEIALERTHANTSHPQGRPGAARRASGQGRNVLTGRGAVRARAHRPGVSAE